MTSWKLRAFIKGTQSRRENFRQLGMFEPLAVNDWMASTDQKCSNKESPVLC